MYLCPKVANDPVLGSRYCISPIARMMKNIKIPTMAYASITDGPVHLIVLAEPINNPTPIVPPKAII
ncbi:hypothetical protein D3C79_1108580 [compost metagenome]